ncbi:uncharacterized protein PG986_008545 [Apiospora aurea]|uniref:ZZ-type domain-containing protein n=1 Tax=Apiospora aurea TaxID=335848 RepID=A0ABR1QG02_9PEZI
MDRWQPLDAAREEIRVLDLQPTLLDFHLNWDAWFFRAWTFQEAVLAKDLVFHAGADFLTLQDLEDYLGSLRQHFLRDGACCVSVAMESQRNLDEANNPFGATMAVLFGLLDARHELRRKGKQPLLEVLNYTAGRSATDPRDLVYAFAGLAHDCLVHITSRLIEHTRSLKVLQYITNDEDLNSPSGTGIRGDNKRRNGLPTWSPDWTQQTDLETATNTNLARAFMRGRFAAGGKGPAEVLFPRPNLLRTPGVLYDTITHLGKPSRDTAGWQYDRACFRQWCFMLANSNAVYRAYCDVCEGEITAGGTRHRCVECGDYDVCVQCLPGVGAVHPGHAFQKIDLGKAPDIVCNSDEEGQVHIQGSYWTMLDTIPYSHVPSQSLQTAFRKTMTANTSFGNTPFGKDSSNNNDLAPFVEAVAFTKFWNTYIEGHNAITFMARRGLTEDAFRGISRAFLTHINTIVSTVVNGKRFFVTEKGYVGWGPKSTEVGDSVSVLPGADVPFLVRKLTGEITPRSDEDGDVVSCTLVGEAYVHGLMNGEALTAVEHGIVSQQTIVIH